VNILIFNLSELKEVGSKREIEKKIKIDNIVFRGREIDIPEPFILNLTVYNTNDSFIFTGKLIGYMILACSRCLEEFKYPVDIDINEEIEKKNIKDIKNIDLEELFIENILLSIPIKPLCSENCQGICPKCGQNMNEGQCDCDTEAIDPRLAKLKDLLDE